MDKILKYLMLILITTFSFTFTSCGDDNDDDEPDSATSKLDFYDIEKKLLNTSWKLTYRHNQNSNSKGIGDILTFSSESYGNYRGVNYSNPSIFSIYINGEKMGAWCGSADNRLSITYAPWDASTMGGCSAIYGIGPYLKSITSTQLIFEDDEYNQKWIYSSVANNGNNGGSGNSDNNSDLEKPDIYYSDFTPGTTTLKVVFKISNKDRTKVTSAKGYCGSKSVNGSIGSGTITFNFSGLSRGTKYTVYCTADSPGGSTTSDKVTLSTLY